VEGIVLVLCWGPSCGVCHNFEPVFRRIAEEHPDHTFAKMDVQTHADLGEFFEIRHTPTLLLYRDGLLLFRKPGVFDAKELRNIIAQAESLDMDRVRADAEAGAENK
jgi:thioredoxin 1